MWKILWAALCGFFMAWALSILGFDEIFIKGAYQLFHISIKTEGYYFMFIVLSVIISLIEKE